MNISDLFEEIQDRFSPEDLNGEISLQGNCLVWSYKVENDIEDEDEASDFEDDDPLSFEVVSCEELLQDAYNEDFEKIETFFDELNLTNNWAFSDADIVDFNKHYPNPIVFCSFVKKQMNYGRQSTIKQGCCYRKKRHSDI
jgi:hypothetical protein